MSFYSSCALLPSPPPSPRGSLLSIHYMGIFGFSPAHMFCSNNDEWARFPYGKQFFHLVTKISCPIKVNEGGCVSSSFLVISKGEPCGERKAVLPRVKQLVPREGEMVRSGPPLSPGGPLPGMGHMELLYLAPHSSIWN